MINNYIINFNINHTNNWILIKHQSNITEASVSGSEHGDQEGVTQGRACSTNGSGLIPMDGLTELLKGSPHSCLENRTSNCSQLCY